MPEKFVMLVEDDSDHVALILRSLRKQGMADEVMVMLDGQEALDFLFAQGTFAQRDPLHLPSVILLDLKLPKMNGLQVLKRVRAEERTRTLPVVVLTSSDAEEDVHESYRLGANSYVRKPTDFREFLDAINRLIYYWTRMNQAV
ncbi:MAG TPA: response regulator [Candidatus Sulfotelmatobacter sp.]|nr:response regulator [Candidatus Sulfotelmatobacter sp.]HWI60562.1 response regulator [Symbiobacteriaceae bacterium]